MNLPNRLSFLRIILVPVFLAMIMINFTGHYFVAIGVFVIAAFTDFLDGYIARKYNLVTNMGKFLDSVADKMLTTTALIAVACYGLIPNPYGLICVCLFVVRDLAINVIRQIGASKNVIIPADKLGKYKAFSLDIALPIIFLYAGLMELSVNATVVTAIMWVGYGFMIIASILNIISGIHYICKNKKVFSED